LIARILLTALLAGVVLYAWTQLRKSPAVGVLAMLAAFAGGYFVWVPAHATRLAEWAGVGRGVDLILYTWVVISLLILLNLHLKVRAQMQLITTLTRQMGIAEAARAQDARPTSSPCKGDHSAA
jgi:hypothetical protein